MTERDGKDLVASRLAAIVDSSDDAIISKDLDGTVTTWNRGAERLFGFLAEEMIGQPILRLIPPDRHDEEIHILGRIRRGERVPPFDTVRLCRDGRAIDVSVTASPIKTSSGEIIGASKVARDISRRKRADEATRLAQGRYRALFDHAPDGIVVSDRDGRLVDANASFCRLLGYTHEELTGRLLAEVLATEEADVFRNGGIAGLYRTLHVPASDGAPLTVELVTTTMPDGITLTMVRDVTERLRTTSALRTAEERMRFALEAAGVGIWDLDYTTGELQWSPILEAQYGFAPGTFSGTYDAGVERIHPDDRAAVADAMAAAVRSGTDFTVAHRVVLPDGSIR